MAEKVHWSRKGPTNHFLIRMPTEMKRQATRCAHSLGLSLQAFILQAVAEKIRDFKGLDK